MVVISGNFVKMATCAIFEEDEVLYQSEKGCKWGLVLESSEYASSDDEEVDESVWQNVKRGTVRVAWHPSGEEEVIAENQVSMSCPFDSAHLTSSSIYTHNFITS